MYLYNFFLGVLQRVINIKDDELVLYSNIISPLLVIWEQVVVEIISVIILDNIHVLNQGLSYLIYTDLFQL